MHNDWGAIGDGGAQPQLPWQPWPGWWRENGGRVCMAEDGGGGGAGAGENEEGGQWGWIGPRILTELALIQRLSLPTAADCCHPQPKASS